MREVTPTRQWTFLYNLKSRQTKDPPPILLLLKCAWTSATAPLSIVRPADRPVPPDRGYVFVNDRQTAISQHATDFIQHETRILRMMQHITKQHRIEAVVSHREMTTIIRKIINPSICIRADVQANYRRSEHALEMMRDKSITAANVEH